MKAFFWTPHTQMLNSLVPLVAVMYCRQLIRGRNSIAPVVLGLAGFTFGLAELAYGTFVIVIGAGGVAYLVGRHMAGDQLRSSRTVVALCSLAGGFAAPNVAWIAICRVLSGGYYSGETEQYHEFVWIPQHIRDGFGPFLSRLAGYSVLELRSVFPAAAVPLIMVASIALASIWLSVPFLPAASDRRAIALACWLTLAFEILFLYGVGVYLSRISYLLAPPLLVLAGVGLAEIRDRSPASSRIIELGLAIGAASFTLHQLVAHGPYS